jgi:hypothetical protein
MNNDRDADGRTPLWRALQALSRGDGILRDSLIEDLNPETGELRELQKYWKIDLHASLKVVRDAVLSRLDDYLDEIIEPRRARQGLTSEDRREQYFNAVRISFHMWTHPDLKGADLSERRDWLAKDARGKLRIKPSISQDDLNHAISQIEQQILAGCEPIKSVAGAELKNGADDPGCPPVVAPVGKSPEITADGRSTSWMRCKPIWLAVSSVVVVGVAATIFVIATNRSTPSGTPSHTSSSNGQPVPVTMAAGPVSVESIAYVRDGSRKSLGYSYVFPQKVQLSADDLAGLNKLNGKSAEYWQWMLSRGGVNTDDSPIQFTMRNKSNKSIIVTNMQPAAQCKQPLSATLFYAPEQGAEGDIRLAVNLDDKIPVIRDRVSGASYFGGEDAKIIRLEPGETSTLLIDAITTKYYCQLHFNLIVDPEDGSSPISESFDNNGKPFEVSAVPKVVQGGNVKFSYYQKMYAFYQDTSPADLNPTGSGGLAYGPVNPVTYNGR